MIRQHIIRTLIFGILGLILGLGVAFLSRPVYEGRVQMVVGTRDDQYRSDTRVGEDVNKILQAGGVSTATTEAQILRGQALFAEALTNVATRRNQPELAADWERYYRMYDVLADEKSNVAIILARMYNAELASELADEVSRVYSQVRQRSTRQSLIQATQYLQLQSDQAKKDVDLAQRKLREYKNQVGVADYENQVLQLTAFRQNTQAKLDEATGQLGAARAEVDRLRASLAALPRTVAASSADIRSPIIQQLESRIADLRVTRAQLRERFLQDSEEMRTIDAQIASAERDLRVAKQRSREFYTSTQGANPVYQQVQGSLISAQSRVASLERLVQSFRTDLSSAEARLQALPDKEEQLSRLQRDLQVKEAAFVSLQSQLDAIRNRAEVQPDPAQVLYPSRVDDEPVAPDHAKYAFIGLLAGISLGLVFSFLMEASRLRVYTSQQLVDLTGVPVVGTIRSMPPRMSNRLLSGLNAPDVPVLESVRFMAFAATADPAHAPKRILFTGSGLSVGTSMAAGQFALATARTGLRVILIDGDLQRQSITQAFGLKGKSGLSDILRADQLPSVESIVAMPTQHENLFVVPAGTSNPEQIKESAGNRLSGLLEMIGQTCDLIVIDTPACNQVSDAVRLASFVDEIFLVVSARSANLRVVTGAQQLLARSGARINLVMTDANMIDEAAARQVSFAMDRA